MNERAAAALYEAERKGVRQVYGTLSEGDGQCALGVLKDALGANDYFLTWSTPVRACPLCGATQTKFAHDAVTQINDEWSLIAHLNDDHRLTFSEIARKLGPDSV